MNINKIIKLYRDDKWTLRMIADKFSTNHHMIKKILVENGIETDRRKTLKPYTDEHRRKVGLASKGRQTNLGKKMPEISLYRNMKAHLKYNVSLEWLLQFDDVEKLKFLNRSIIRDRDKIGFTTETYKAFTEKFYTDTQFNLLYKAWLGTNNKWLRPSLDHITARCNGGKCSVDNFQFLSWFENRAKMDMTQQEWEDIKMNIKDYLL
jgi:hypothetical protein